MKDLTCENCRFRGQVPGGEPDDFECRRYAPRPFPYLEFTNESMKPSVFDDIVIDVGKLTWWPRVALDDWCGDWDGKIE